MDLQPSAFSLQPSLFEATPPPSSNTDVAWLENYLDRLRDWATAADLLQSLGRPVTDANTRWVRALASDSFWVVSGQRGYKHIRHATAEEVNHACAWLESQAKKMSERAGGIRKNAHRIFG